MGPARADSRGAPLAQPRGCRGARFIESLRKPVSWAFLAKFCFLPAQKKNGLADKVQGMMYTAVKVRHVALVSSLLTHGRENRQRSIPRSPLPPLSPSSQFKIDSDFTLLHYSQMERSGSGSKDSDNALKGWEEVYEGDSTCSERMANSMSHPFFLSKLARAAMGSRRRKLLSSERDVDAEGWVEEIDLHESGLNDASGGALYAPAPVDDFCTPHRRGSRRPTRQGRQVHVRYQRTDDHDRPDADRHVLGRRRQRPDRHNPLQRQGSLHRRVAPHVGELRTRTGTSRSSATRSTSETARGSSSSRAPTASPPPPCLSKG